MKSIAIINQKGGVAKTTTTINLAHYFALQGKKVLIMDLDGQGHVAPSLGLRKNDGLLRLIVNSEPIEKVAMEARKNMWLITNDHTAEQVKLFVEKANFREYLLSTILEEAAAFDIVLMDCPPSADVLHVLALVASDLAMIPANLDYLAMEGVLYVLKTIKSMARYPNVVPPIVVGVLPTMYDRVTKETVQNVMYLQQAVGADMILPPIPRDTKIREASSRGQTIWEHAPDSAAAIGYSDGSKMRNSRGLIGGYLHAGEITMDAIKVLERRG